MSQVSTEQIKNSLKQCMDPEVPLSIVDMGLIYGIDVTENNDVTRDAHYMILWLTMLLDMQKKFLV